MYLHTDTYWYILHILVPLQMPPHRHGLMDMTSCHALRPNGQTLTQKEILGPKGRLKHPSVTDAFNSRVSRRAWKHGHEAINTINICKQANRPKWCTTCLEPVWYPDLMLQTCQMEFIWFYNHLKWDIQYHNTEHINKSGHFGKWGLINLHRRWK